MSRWRWIVGVVLGSAIGLHPRAHAAQAEVGESSRIAVLGTPDAAVSQQLEAELALLGFEVVHAPAPTHADPETLRALARELDVVAAVLVDTRAQDLDLWIVDRVTGKILVRRVPVEAAEGGDAARITAVRAIDLLRASFRELEAGPPPPAAEVQPTTVVRRVAVPRPSRFVLGFGPAVSGSAGGLGAMAHAVVMFEAWPKGPVGLGVRGWIPIAGVRTSAAAGSASVLVGWFGVGPRFRLTRPERRLTASLGTSVGAAFVGMRGDASPPYRGRHDLVATAIFELDAGLTIAVHPRLRIWIDAVVGAAVPRAGIRIAGDRVATWGLPVGAGIVGLAFPL